MALRSADRRVHPSSWHRTSRGSDADDRPDGRARLRPGHDRPAAEHLDRLHRQRSGRDHRRSRLRPRALCLRVVGADLLWPARGSRLIGCCARAASGAIAIPTKFARAQRDADYIYRLAVDPAPAKELRLFGLASWTIDRFVARRSRLHALQYEATRLRENPDDQPAARCRRQRRCLLVVVQRGSARQPEPGGVRRVCAERRRRVDDCLWRAQLGARWSVGAGRGGPAARACHGRARSLIVAIARTRVRPQTDAGERDLLPRPDVRLSRRPAGPRRPRPDHAGRIVSRNRRPERRRQDDAGKAAVPLLRPGSRGGRDRWRRPPGISIDAWRSRVDRGLPGLHPFRALRARQRRACRGPG